jgi:hypothetical protein
MLKAVFWCKHKQVVVCTTKWGDVSTSPILLKRYLTNEKNLVGYSDFGDIHV